MQLTQPSFTGGHPPTATAPVLPVPAAIRSLSPSPSPSPSPSRPTHADGQRPGPHAACPPAGPGSRSPPASAGPGSPLRAAGPPRRPAPASAPAARGGAEPAPCSSRCCMPPPREQPRGSWALGGPLRRPRLSREQCGERQGSARFGAPKSTLWSGRKSSGALCGVRECVRCVGHDCLWSSRTYRLTEPSSVT